jgi:hypothetical protein
MAEFLMSDDAGYELDCPLEGDEVVVAPALAARRISRVTRDNTSRYPVDWAASLDLGRHGDRRCAFATVSESGAGVETAMQLRVARPGCASPDQLPASRPCRSR